MRQGLSQPASSVCLPLLWSVVIPLVFVAWSGGQPVQHGLCTTIAMADVDFSRWLRYGVVVVFLVVVVFCVCAVVVSHPCLVGQVDVWAVQQ
jgi:hypothetical protein